MNKLSQIKKTLLLLTSLSLGFLPLPLSLLNQLPAVAGCGFGDITCNPKNWTCPPGGCREETGATADFAPRVNQILSLQSFNFPSAYIRHANSLGYISTIDSNNTAMNDAKSNYSTILIAQAFLDARCPEEYVYLQGETVNYTVKICGSRSTGLPTHYLSESKKNGSGFILPLSSYTPGRFVVRDGKYTYILDTKAQTLTIRFPRKRPRIERFTIDLP